MINFTDFSTNASPQSPKSHLMHTILESELDKTVRVHGPKNVQNESIKFEQKFKYFK